jgi:DNA-directed RNA polymerase sigma subunit (sigma70/sigma32)
MIKPLTAQERAIIQQSILDLWNPHRLTWKIANHFDLSENQIRHIKSKATFFAR